MLTPFIEEELKLLRDELTMKENANILPSAGAMYERVVEKLTYSSYVREVLNKFVPEGLRCHEAGDIYIHKLPGCLVRLYCGSVQSTVIPKAGLKTMTTVSKPPRHLDACVDQLSRVAIALSFEREGAVGLNEVDLALAPYVRFDVKLQLGKLTRILKDKLYPMLNGNAKLVDEALTEYGLDLASTMLEQQVQRLFFTLNNIERPSIQSPFTNVSFTVSYSEKTLSKIDVYWAGQKVGTASDFLDEVVMVFKAFCKLYLAGDATGAPFTFPIPTVIVNNGRLWRILESDPELWELFWKTVAVRGSFYFMNTSDDTVIAFCCRVHCSIDKIRKTLGVWFKPGFVGSINYISINMPRLAWLAKDEADLLERLTRLAEVAREVLMFLRRRYTQLYNMGMYPVTKMLYEAYVGDQLVAMFSNPIQLYYYNTIAVIGLAEAVDIWLRKNNDKKRVSIWYTEDGETVKEIVKFYELVLNHLNKLCQEFEKQDNVMYNVEQAPAESASIKLAIKDIKALGKDYAKYIPRDVDPVTGQEQYFYTSQLTPPYTTYSLRTQLYIEAMCQPLFTGGVSKILQVHTPFYDPSWSRKDQEDGLERLSRLIEMFMSFEPVEGRKMIYLAFTPVQNHCRTCGYLWVGNPYSRTDVNGHPVCPRCGSTNVDTWSRIVGYYRPVRNWNPGKRAEFMSRVRSRII